MNRLMTFTTIATFAGGLLLAGPAFASHALDNGDAEDGDTTGWTADPTVDAVNSSGDIGAPNNGDFFFSTGEGDVGAGNSAGLDQDVFVWGCGVEFLQASYDVDAWIASGGGTDADSGQVFTEFFDFDDNSLGGDFGSPTGDGTGAWSSGGSIAGETVPVDSVTMNVELVGTANADGDDNANVGFDDVALTLTGCLDAFAKISGRAGSFGRGNGNNNIGEWAFAGSVGTSHDDGSSVGAIVVNYRSVPDICTFEPDGDITYDGLDEAKFDATYTCDSTASGDAFVRMISGDPTTNNQGNNMDRGAICITADDSAYDVGTDCDDDLDNDPEELTHGNVWVDDDTSTAEVF